MRLLSLIKYFLVFSFAAVVAVTLGLGFAVGALIFIVVSRLFGRKPATASFRVYTTRDLRDTFERPPMRDVTPKKVESLPESEVQL